MKASWSYPGSTCEQIKALIDAWSPLSTLRQDLQSGSPPTAFQPFVNALRVGSSVPLQSLTGYSSTVRPTAATRPGVVTTRPRQVAYGPGKGDPSLADFGAGHRRVPHLSPAPLAPEDAVALPPAR